MPEPESLPAIRSVSLDDLLAGREPWWHAPIARKTLIVPVISLAVLAVAGLSAAYFISSGPDDGAVLKAAHLETSEPINTGSIPDPDTMAALPQAVEPREIPEPAAVEAARLPKPRPPAPAYALGGAGPYADRRYAYADQRQNDPCAALQAMSAYLPFQVYCVTEPHAPPPYPRYRPYSPYGYR